MYNQKSKFAFTTYGQNGNAVSIVYPYTDLQRSRSVNVFLFLNYKAKQVTPSLQREAIHIANRTCFCIWYLDSVLQGI